MLKINEVIVVEGKYDKNTLSRMIDTTILVTNGFGIFNDPDRMTMLRSAAECRGLVILTDSDHAGFMIRNRIKAAIDSKYLKNAYIPDVFGKEKRKRKVSKEGKLGVEGMPEDVLIDVLLRAGVTQIHKEHDISPKSPITKADMYFKGYTGRENSSAARAALKRKFSLPENLSVNSLLDVLNVIISREEFMSMDPQNL